MSYHSGTIHTVRFSPGGKFLASGADDKYVCVYTLDPNPPRHTNFGSNEAPPVEHWPVFRRLMGHDNDVQDLGWSYDGTILVSVGLDSKIVVWSGFIILSVVLIHDNGLSVSWVTKPGGDISEQLQSLLCFLNHSRKILVSWFLLGRKVVIVPIWLLEACQPL